MVLVNSAPESAILPVIAGVGGAGLLALVFLLLRRFRRQPVSPVEVKPNNYRG